MNFHKSYGWFNENACLAKRVFHRRVNRLFLAFPGQMEDNLGSLRQFYPLLQEGRKLTNNPPEEGGKNDPESLFPAITEPNWYVIRAHFFYRLSGIMN
jgi:hypothetical protein